MATRKPRQSGSVEDCAVQQALWTIGGKWGVSRKEVGQLPGCLTCREFGGNDSLRTAVPDQCAGYSRTSVWVMVYLTLTLTIPVVRLCHSRMIAEVGSLWVSSFWGRLFDERRDSNRGLGAFVFWAVA